MLQGIVIPDDQGWFTHVPEFEVAAVRSRPVTVVSSLRVYYIYPFMFAHASQHALLIFTLEILTIS